MSVKTLTRVAAASAILGVAVLSPSVAQAKDEPALAGAVSLTACDGSTTTANGNVAPTSFTISVPAKPAADTYEYRARVFQVVNGKKVFSTKRVRVPSTATFGGGSIPANHSVWRLDVVNTTAEAAGLPALVFTSAGLIGCD